MINANSFQEKSGDLLDEFPNSAWKVVVPPDYNKTRLHYKWPVPKEMAWMKETVKKLHKREPRL